MKQKSTGVVQAQTVHVTKRNEPNGVVYFVWLGEQLVTRTDDRQRARVAARKTGAGELTECWERGKAFERTPRGAWKPVSG